MLDFRYHALSLVAVFLALAIGILLGATIGEPFVSAAEEGVRSDLRNNVDRLSEERDRAVAEREDRDRVIEQVFPMVAGSRLAGEDIAIVATGELPDDVDAAVSDAVEVAGATVTSKSVLELGDGTAELADAAGGEWSGLEAGDAALEPLLRQVGLSIARGGPLVRRMQERLPERFRSELTGADAVAVYRAPPASGESAAQRGARERLERALIEGLRGEGVPVVGVEETDTDPSQIGFYSDNELSSVDDVDLMGGRLALVFALDGAEGTFGSKETADRALPEVAAGIVGG